MLTPGQVVLIVAIGVGATASGHILTPRDDTDPPSGARSGLVVFTDHKTGCQYLGRGLTGLAPRMDGQGKQVGCRPELVR